MSHLNDATFDCALAYHSFVRKDTEMTAHEHLIAAGLAGQVADYYEILRAGAADSASERRMFLTAADKARKTQNQHELYADIITIGDQVCEG